MYPRAMSFAPRSRWALLAPPFAALLAASACIPAELAAGAGAGAGTGAGGGTGGVSTGGIGVSGSNPGGAGGSTVVLCESAACEAKGGVCDSGACVFHCTQPGSCAPKLSCPAAMPCRVECDGMSACAGGADGAHAASFEVFCNGPKSCGVAGAAAAFDCPDGGGTCRVWCETDACAQAKVNGGPAGANVVCEGSGACADLLCNGQCTVTCGAMNACASLTCAGGPCDVACSSEGTCADVACKNGQCTIDCQGQGACGSVACGTACACDVTCGANACPPVGAICPGDTDNMGPCSMSAGCTSAPAGCDTCP